MRMRTLCYLAAACLAGGGCFSARPSAPSSFLHLSARNLAQNPIRSLDNQFFKCAAYKHAEVAWKQAQEVHCGEPLSEDYADGFIEGFVDFVDAGGNGEPPATPPFRYRLTSNESSAGVRAVQQWYAGFRHGAAAARASGLREVVIVPLASIPDADPYHTQPQTQRPEESEGKKDDKATPTLPTPKPADPVQPKATKPAQPANDPPKQKPADKQTSWGSDYLQRRGEPR